MLAQSAQVRILGEPFEITIAERERLLERRSRHVHVADQRVTAGKIVKHQRVRRLEPRQLFVHLQSLVEPAALGIMIAEQLQGLHVGRVPPDDAFDELDLDVQLACLLASHLFSSAAVLRHTTDELFPSNASKSRARRGGKMLF